MSENNTIETLSEPSRSSCQFAHTTTFAVVADIDQVKEDKIIVVRVIRNHSLLFL